MAYVTLFEAKRWLNITDSSDDDLLLILVDAATAAINNFLNRSLSSATYVETLVGTGTALLFPRNAPITDITQVIYSGLPIACGFDSIAISRSDGGIFDAGVSAEVTYTAGYATIPGDVKFAALQTVQAMRNAQAMDPNLGGESLGGVFSGSYNEFGPGAMPRSARDLLRSYIRHYAAP